MTRDHGLEQLIRDDLRSTHGLSEKVMFGGLAWMLHGNLLCCARDDGMLVRLGKGRDAWALQIAGIEPMMSGNRTMHGWVRCDLAVYGEDALRRQLIESAIEFVEALPEK